MSEDVQKLKTRNFSVQMNELTLRDNENILIAYVRYVDEYNFTEDMFCKRLASTAPFASYLAVRF